MVRRNSPAGADPASIVDQDADLIGVFRRQRSARRRIEAGDVLPLDMIGDPAAAREAIARRL